MTRDETTVRQALALKPAATLWGRLAICGRLSIGPLRLRPTGGGNQPPRRLSTQCHSFFRMVPDFRRSASLSLDFSVTISYSLVDGSIDQITSTDRKSTRLNS